MVWTKAQVDEIAEELLATDIPYDLNALQGYDEDGLRAFFENGGSDEAPPEPTLSSSSGCWGPLPEEVKWKVNANGTVAVITMNRPAENNAMDDNLIAGLVMCVKRVQESPDLRVCFLTGAGKMFCAGGDPKAFQKAAALAKEAEAKGVLGTADDQNVSGAMTFAQMLQDLSKLECYTVALANGTAMGGGYGLLCCCDCVVAKKSAMFALSEVKLGVIPATISPYVVARIGVSNSRRFFMTGEAVTCDVAQSAGLVNVIVEDDKGLEAEARRICKLMNLVGPEAAKAAKKLVANVANKPIDASLMKYTADQLAAIRMGKEAEGGMIAVQTGQKPPWATKELIFPSD